jgi:hypothetical protein
MHGARSPLKFRLKPGLRTIRIGRKKRKKRKRQSAEIG